MAPSVPGWYAEERRRLIPKVLYMMAYTALVSWVPLLLIIAFGNPWYGMYRFIKAVATAGVDIDIIGIKIIPLFNRFVIINNIFTFVLVLGGRSVIKSMDISCNGPRPELYSRPPAGIYPW